MKQFFALLSNELFKETKRVSFLVLSILAVVIVILAPFVQLFQTKIISGVFEDLSMDKDFVQEQMDDLKKEDQNDSGIICQLIPLRQQLEGYNLSEKLQIDTKDWRQEVLNDYTNAQTAYLLMQACQDGKISQSDALWSMDPSQLPKEWAQIIYTEDDINFSADQWAQVTANKKEEAESMLQSIVKNNPDIRLAALETKAEKALAAAQQAAAVTNQTVSNQLLSKQQVVIAEKSLWCYQQLRKEHAKPQQSDWRWTTIQVYQSNLQGDLGVVAMTRDEYNLAASNKELDTDYGSYERYLKETTTAQEKARKEWMRYEYSLKKGVPTVETVENDARWQWSNAGLVGVTLAGILMMVIGGSIVASEFSSGTIRLLLIRPEKRWKILLSKLCCMILIGLSAVLIFGTLSMLLGILVSLGNNLTVPILVQSGIHTLEIPALFVILWQQLLAFLPFLCLASIGFLLGTLTHRGALGIVLPILIYTFNGIFAGASMMLRMFLGYNPLAYTVLPYFNLDGMVSFPTSVVGQMGMMSDLLNGVNNAMDSGLILWVGCIMLVLHTALFCFFSFLSFGKQQIKD